jgi:hypothetical protein
VLVQIGHRRGNRPLMVGLDRFVGDVVGKARSSGTLLGAAKGLFVKVSRLSA